MSESEDSGDSGGWLVHDIVIGAVAGAALGLVVGIFIVARVDNQFAMWLSVGVFLVIGIVLLRLERNRRRGIGPVTILTWVTMVGSLGFVALVIAAVRNFT